jgi:hypothetical protein
VADAQLTQSPVAGVPLMRGKRDSRTPLSPTWFEPEAVTTSPEVPAAANGAQGPLAVIVALGQTIEVTVPEPPPPDDDPPSGVID